MSAADLSASAEAAIRPDAPGRLGSPYQGYAYSYPHKSAYRPLGEPRRLDEVWADEDRGRIGVYVHIPFCEMRCGFCNLFTAANPGDDIQRLYLDALEREIGAAAAEFGPFRPRNLTLGGGTPTYLDAPRLARLFDILSLRLGLDGNAVPAMAETSPKTATPERLNLLAERGVRRISIGVQSFVEAETRALGRPQKPAEPQRALDSIRQRGFETLNIDLIYGAAGQSAQSWLTSLRRALDWSPEEMFLYPLYVRPLTGLNGRAQSWDDHRLALYRIGRDFLLSQGYRQISMRMFRKSGGTNDAAGSADGEAGHPGDSLLGLGCGARSRTSRLHYSSDYAVGRAGVLSIMRDYCERSEEDFSAAAYGVAIDRDAEMRRMVLKGVLRIDGLDLTGFEQRFGTAALACFPELQWLKDAGFLVQTSGRLCPTASGLEYADAIGPLLYSGEVRSRMMEFPLK